MNCDQVFDVLTRGPFPTGAASDVNVEEHLAGCADCQRLARALQPALELIQESVSVEEGRDLPGYWGEIADVPAPRGLGGTLAQIAQSPASITQHVKRGGWLKLHPAYRMTAAIVLGMALGAAFYSTEISHQTADRAGHQKPLAAIDQGDYSSESRGSSTANREHRAQLGLVGLASACFGIRWTPESGDLDGDQALVRLAEGADYDQVRCCTHCHRSDSKEAPAEATAAVARTCHICHR